MKTTTTRENDDPYGRFLPMSEVEATVGIRRTKIYELIRDGNDPFPSPIHIGTRSLWLEKEVIAWKEKQVERCRGARH